MKRPSDLRAAAPACTLALLFAACTPTPPAQPAEGNATPPKAARDVAPDPYQEMALAAGRELIGAPAPRLSVKTIDGNAVRLGATGRPIYLKFWATWCVTCREQMPAFIADYERLKQDIDVVAVNTGVNDDLAAVEAYRREVGLRMPIALDDGRLSDAFRLRVTPQHVIIGRDGVIRYVGHLDDDRLRSELQAAIEDRTVQERTGVEAPSPRPRDSAATSLATVQGGRVDITGPTAGKPRLLYFFSPWCETYLAKSRPTVADECRSTREALTRAMQADQVSVIGVASGLSADADGVQRYLRRTKFDAPVVLDADGALFRQFGVRSFPAVIRLDAAGRPVGRMAAKDVDAFVRASPKGA